MISSKTLIDWYSIHKRELPWRATKNPYYIWLSEIILQQTQVAQGLPYYSRFVKEFPTIYDLAEATENDVLKLWQGLGYYSRARNLHHTAKQIVNDFRGVFPEDYNGLIKLKGVGDYTASAIASICYNEVQPVLDGNVYRFISRYYGVETPINTPIAKKEFKTILFEIIDKENPAEFNQAIMEFGARQCKPKSPNCKVCPFKNSCFAFSTNRVLEFPVKQKKIKVKKRVFNYLVFITSGHETYLEKRTGKGIWKNLYQFPLLETESSIKKHEVLDFILSKYEDIKVDSLELYNTTPIVHKLSHQHLYTTFWVINVENFITNTHIENLRAYPFPILISNFIESYNFETISNP